MKVIIERKLSFIFLFISIAFIVYGAYRSEVDTVLTKAIKICLECIGIG